MKVGLLAGAAVLTAAAVVACAVPRSGSSDHVRSTFAEWSATRPLGGMDLAYAARDGIRLAPATRGTSVTRAQALAAAHVRKSGWLPGRPVSSGLYDVDIVTTKIEGVGKTRGMWVVSFATTSWGFGPGPNRPEPATAFIFVDGRSGKKILSKVG